ncbi:cellulase family glycosylhydrolase [Mycolicibacterium llatzerense]|uniref:cellulase family glycosylhydrolase n=1 Tax=Mycolicibacterium llatzerense TaxID=280871 RepID=UPI0021B5BB1C|nr:cellulase family glycosylhydrolase [Mycolicibacterium llatzerense]
MLRVVVVFMPLAVLCAYSHVAPTQPRSVAIDVIPTAEIDPEASSVGIADSSLYGLSPADINKTLDQLQSIGVQNIRVFVPWALIKMTGPNDLPNDANWQLMNNVMDAARAHNMGVLAVVSHTPLWAAPSGTIPGAGAPDPAVYADFVKQVATRYGDVISAYEVWNEPNSFTFFQPMDPVKYTAILKAVYTTLKGGDGTVGADPTSTVIAGALAPLQDFFGATASPQTFLAAMYAAGAKGFFDAISVHPYEFNQVLKFSQGGALNPFSALYQVQQMRAIMVQNGDGQKLIWATEYGFQTVLDQLGVVDPTSNQKQADFIQDFITTWRALTYTGPLFIYTTRDGVPGTDTGYGIFQADWTAKLAVKVISDAIGLPPVIVSPIVALAELIQKAFAQFQKAFTSFTASLQTAFANAVKAFQSLISGIFKPAAAQANATASLAPAAASVSADTVAAANLAAKELKSQVGGSKDTAEHAKAGDKSESGDVKVVDAAEHEAAGAVDPKAVETKAEGTKTEEPKTETPKVDDTKAETPKTDTPKTDTPKVDDTKAETPAVETPKAETPKTETPKTETPKAEAPKAETPKSETSQTDSSGSETPKPTTNEPKTQTKDGATQDKSDSGKAGTKGKTGKKPGKAKKQTPAAASEPAKPAGRANGDGGGKDSSTDSKTHQHQGS